MNAYPEGIPIAPCCTGFDHQPLPSLLLALAPDKTQGYPFAEVGRAYWPLKVLRAGNLRKLQEDKSGCLLLVSAKPCGSPADRVGVNPHPLLNSKQARGFGVWTFDRAKAVFLRRPRRRNFRPGSVHLCLNTRL